MDGFNNPRCLLGEHTRKITRLTAFDRVTSISGVLPKSWVVYCAGKPYKKTGLLLSNKIKLFFPKAMAQSGSGSGSDDGMYCFFD